MIRNVWNLIRRSMSGRAIALTAALVLAVGGITGGTIAWLIGRSSPITNTFTPSNIAVTITETETGDGDEDPNTNTYSMLPGAAIHKDPIITLAGNSEDSWLFVEMVKSANFDQYMTYEMAEGWTELEGTPGVFWRETVKTPEDQTFGVILNDEVTVLPEVTAAMLNQLTTETLPTLTVTAYAVQHVGVNSAADAWLLAQGE